MRLIDADALKDYIDAQEGRPFIGCTVGEALKIMTDEQPTIADISEHLVQVTKEEALRAGLEGREMKFRLEGRRFAIRELAQ